jgi:hypothetical protein
MKKQAKRVEFTSSEITSSEIKTSLAPIGVGIERRISGVEEARLVAAFESNQHSNTSMHVNLSDECLLAALQAENTQLRQEVVELALDVLDLQIRSEVEADGRSHRTLGRAET